MNVWLVWDGCMAEIETGRICPVTRILTYESNAKIQSRSEST